jgi:hypothetical protein
MTDRDFQSVIDEVVPFLYKQRPSFNESNPNVSHCAYRGPNGSRCAIGYYIPDDLYDPLMELKMVTSQMVWSGL